MMENTNEMTIIFDSRPVNEALARVHTFRHHNCAPSTPAKTGSDTKLRPP